MWTRIRQLLEMIRFSHTLFALPFALFAAVMAWTTPASPPVEFRWRDLLGVLCCMVFARSAAMAFNRLADARIDAGNPRTATRHLPAGILSRTAVAVFTIACSVGFLASTVLFWPNRLPSILALPVLAFIFGYSYTKRFTVLAHFWLGAALLLAPVCAWLALRGREVMAGPLDLLPAAWLGVGVLFWVAGFDIIYACQDAAFDARAKLKSIPAAWGIPASLRLAAVCHVLMICILFTLPYAHLAGGPRVSLGGLYLAGIAAISALLAYEHWLVKPGDLTRVNVAFFHVNAVVSVGLLLVAALDLMLG